MRIFLLQQGRHYDKLVIGAAVENFGSMQTAAKPGRAHVMKGHDNPVVNGLARHTPATSATLLEQVQQGDSAGYQRLMMLYRPVLLWKCGNLVADGEREDIVQEVFHTVSQKIGTFKRERDGSFRKWLYGIIRNKIGDYLRKTRDRAIVAGGTDAQ